MAREQITFPIGERLPGTKYVVVKKLGQGGMGVVLEVVKEPKIRAVVKIIHPHLAADASFRARFFDEVRLLAELDHPNIVRVNDYDQLEDGTPYFAMEFLRGNTVRHVLKNKGVVQPIHLHRIMQGLLDGLDYIHSHHPQVVHRDIKSENVFIHVPNVGEPCIKVIDFGVAGGDSIVEESGLVLGTPGHAAPEQLRGKRVTPQADLYSAALILYEGLAGRGPFDDVALVPADDGERRKALIRAHLQLAPPSVKEFAPWVPRIIDELLRSALSKNPRDRPESARAFAEKLHVLRFIGDGPIAKDRTVPTLGTMTEEPAPSERAPARSSELATRQMQSGRLNDATIVDDVPAGLRALTDVPQDQDDIETFAPPLRASFPPAVGSSAPPPDLPKPGFRSFAEAEANRAKRRPLGRRRAMDPEYAEKVRKEVPGVLQADPRARRASSTPRAETEPGLMRTVISQGRARPTPAPAPKTALWLLAIGLSVVGLSVFLFLTRGHATPSQSAAPAPARSVPAIPTIAPLPPEDPKSSPATTH